MRSVLSLFCRLGYPPGMPQPQDLKPATPEDLADALAFELRCGGRKQVAAIVSAAAASPSASIAALLTGCRYGELTRMRSTDFNGEAGKITVQISKAGKPRHVALTDEGRGLFENLTAGRSSRDAVFVRDDGKVWGASHQQRPLEAASQRARIEPAATFHILRHTYASSLAMRGVPMGVIAAQLGQADTRMTERHYAHLAPNYVAETVRAALSPLGIVDRLNVAALARREKVRST